MCGGLWSLLGYQVLASEHCDNGISDDDSEYDTAHSDSLEADDDAEDTDGNSKGEDDMDEIDDDQQEL